MSELRQDETAQHWESALGDKINLAAPTLVRTIVVRNEIPSTQDECRRRSPGRPGCLVTTLRQTAGRGRLGRRWADDRAQGVALTVSVASQSPERLSVAAAVAVCEAVEHFAGRPLGIRWPNDIMADGRKLAGILIEQQSGVAFIGVGVNGNQTEWLDDLAATAISLRQLTHAAVDRIEVIASIVTHLTNSLGRDDDDLAAAFACRDTLIGTTQTFILNTEHITGVVERVDPFRGLLLRTPGGLRSLPSSQASLLHGVPAAGA